MSSVKENAWTSGKRDDGNQQYHANASRAVCYAGAPGRRDGWKPVQITGARSRKGPGPVCCVCFFVFLGIAICWLYKQPFQMKPTSLQLRVSLLDLAGPPLPGRRVRKNFFTGARTHPRRP